MASSKYSNEYPIDVVIYWVDGNDSKWIEKKNRYVQNSSEESSGNKRYRDWENLVYIFRGIEKFMPWVHKVFFISDDQIPSWLNINCEKLNYVRHTDYIPSEYLPTFSSHPIELNFHRIKDLSEHFIVFNDDMFVIKPMKPEDFFVDGLPADIFMEYPTMTGGNAPVMSHILCNTFNIIGKYYNRSEYKKRLRKQILSPKYGKYFFYNLLMFLIPFPRFFGLCTPHIPRPYLKSTFFDVWEKEGSRLSAVCRNRFRNAEDVNIYLMRLWNLMKGEFYPRDVFKYGNYISIKDNIDQVLMFIRNKKYKLICINDEAVNISESEFEKLKEQINREFDKILPEKSSFEN